MDKETIRRVEFTVPIRTVSEANMRDHWRVKNARKKAQQEEVAVAFHNTVFGRKIELPCSVRMIRYGQKALDSKDLVESFKKCSRRNRAEVGYYGR
jgi:hypothetical protein